VVQLGVNLEVNLEVNSELIPEVILYFNLIPIAASSSPARGG
jgi:hypothetical protein